MDQAARAAWSRAIAALERAERLEAAWGRAHAALDLFRPDGRLNDHGHAQVEIAKALKKLADPEWSRVRHFLKDARGLNFLDRMHRRLEWAEPDVGRRQAKAWRWWLSHRRVPCPDPLMRLVRTVGRGCELTEPEQASFDRVSAVLSDTFRASSAVECMKSELRMQPSRPKVMSQPMLDLKRLYWNCHEFRSGPRKKAGPYQVLGLGLLTYDLWTLLQTGSKKLTQRLSTARNAK